MPSPTGQPMWRGGSCRHGARAWGPVQAASRGVVPAGSPSLVLLLPSSMGFQKPLRKCRPAHKALRAPPTPAASCTAPVPQLMLDVHGPSQPILFWGRLSRKQSLSRCNTPCPSQSSRGAPVSFSLSQRYLQLPPPLPLRPFPRIPSRFSLPQRGLQGRLCHPSQPQSAATGSGGQGTLVWLSGEDP